MNKPFPILTPDEAASLIKNGETIGFSGFTPAGAAKVVPKALAARAKAEHAAGLKQMDITSPLGAIVRCRAA